MSYMVGQKSVLNIPNCIMGIVFYLVQLITGNYLIMITDTAINIQLQTHTQTLTYAYTKQSHATI